MKKREVKKEKYITEMKKRFKASDKREKVFERKIEKVLSKMKKLKI